MSSLQDSSRTPKSCNAIHFRVHFKSIVRHVNLPTYEKAEQQVHMLFKTARKAQESRQTWASPALLCAIRS